MKSLDIAMMYWGYFTASLFLIGAVIMANSLLRIKKRTMKVVKLLLVFLSISFLSNAQSRPPWSGINLVWAPEYGDTLSVVKSIQGVYDWEDVQPSPSTWSWTLLHTDMLRAKVLNKGIVLQLNMPAPDWIEDSVAILGVSRGGWAPQFWNPVYLRIYERVLIEFSNEILADTNLEMVIGVRVQPCAYNTEIIEYSPTEFDSPVPDEDDKSTWQSFPAGYSSSSPDFAPNRTDIVPGTSLEYYQWYLQQVQIIFSGLFKEQGIKPAWRTLLNNRVMGATYRDSLFIDKDSVMYLDTRCGMNANDGMPSRIALIMGQSDSTEGVWEDSQYAWTGHTWQQKMGWTILYKLHSGTAYLATYGAHITYDSAYEMGNRYAGYNKIPTYSPGAWIAFHYDNAVEGNLQMFLSQTDTSVTTDLTDVGGYWQGAYAKSIDSNAVMDIAINAAFYNAIRCRNCQVRITYQNNPGQTFKFGNYTAVGGTGTGEVTTVTYNNHKFTNPTFKITAIEGEPILHMIEILKY